jgi:hypothetical protein
MCPSLASGTPAALPVSRQVHQAQGCGTTGGGRGRRGGRQAVPRTFRCALIRQGVPKDACHWEAAGGDLQGSTAPCVKAPYPALP